MSCVRSNASERHAGSEPWIARLLCARVKLSVRERWRRAEGGGRELTSLTIAGSSKTPGQRRSKKKVSPGG
jgi:hypothetical protein